ncbi:hypothetical protein GCM10010218_51610 [Streptomyces mashuensis]|uniref:DUF916 domain-containing protein n=1 Tax=Streptomyces mashuensis TaxID=33904 RepID=A0A919B8S3_9ACTN|nr:hypothetical protein GCM10010218_51610 [Streptomyces mashuensis]
MAPAAVLALAAASLAPWTAGPAPGADERGAVYVEGAPGSVLADRLALVNRSDRPVTLALRGTGPWISLAAGRVGVPPRTRAEVPLTVTVPPGTPPGDHPAAVLVEGAGRQARVPVAVRVTGPAVSAPAVERVRVTGTGRAAVVHYRVVNRGTTSLAPRPVLRAEGLFGEVLRTRPGSGAPAALPPGGAVDLSEPWPGAPRLDRVRVTVTVTSADGTRASATGTYAPLPWLGPTLAGAGVLAGAAALTLRRRRAHR